MMQPVPYLGPVGMSPGFNQFPTYAFPGVLGEMLFDMRQGGIDPIILGAVLIQAATTIAQGAADVAWPNGSPGKIGANVCLVAPSASGKSLAIQMLNEPINRAVASLDHDENVEGEPDFYLEDATLAAIPGALKSWPIRALVAEEAGMLVQRIKGNSSLATLTKFLDGSPYSFARGDGRRVVLRNHRLSIFLSQQPDVFVETKEILGMTNGSVGLPNRFLFFQGGWPVPPDQLHRAKLTDDTRYRFEERIAKCVEESIRHGKSAGKERPVLSLTHDAEQYLAAIARQATMGISPMGPGHKPSEYVARGAERIRRLAAVFHVFEIGPKGDISQEYVQRAAVLDEWSVRTFAEMTYVPPPITPSMILANALCIFRHHTGITRMRLSEIKSAEINLGLTPAQLQKALAELGGSGRIFVEGKGRATWVNFLHL